MKDNLFKKFLSFSYGSGIGLIIGFLTTMITTRILLPEDFGKASMFTLAINICMIFIIFGTDQSFVRFFYEEQEKNRGGLLYNSLKIPVILAIVMILLILLFSKQISFFLFEEFKMEVILLLVVGIVIQAIYRYAVLVIRMQKKGHVFSLLEIINKILQFAILILFYYLIGPSYEIIIYSTVITFFVLTIASIYFEKNFWSLKNISMGPLKHSKTEIIKYSYPLVITTLITWLFESFNRIALRQWSDFEEIGLFTAAFKIVALLNVVQVAFSTFWSPVCYEKFESNPEDKKFFEDVSKIVSFSMFIIAIGTVLFKDVIVMTLGGEYQDAGKIMPFLVLMPLLYTISETTVIGINFYKKPKWHIFIAGVSCLGNIIGNVLLVPSLGAIGAAISTGSSYLIFFSLRTFISLKYYKINYGLTKIYLSIVTISLYGFYTIYYDRLIPNILLGICSVAIVLFLYFTDILKMYKKFRGNKQMVN